MPQFAAPFLSNSDLTELIDWRHQLHCQPELSGEEAATAIAVQTELVRTNPDDMITDLGGNGVAAIYNGEESGPTILLRCELDALPIEELGDIPYRSEILGKAHLCGHDGHMAILAGVARWLGRNRPVRGRVVLLFQPAEEDGAGAEKVISDPRFAAIQPDYALALHNYPNVPLGHAVLASGPMNCASRGLKIQLTGHTAHASQPEKGLSPAAAMTDLIPMLTALGNDASTSDPEFALTTITHANLGEAAFGVAPGNAEIWVTLRTQQDAMMAKLVAQAERHVHDIGQKYGLEIALSYHDTFNHCINNPDATQMLADALQAENIPVSAGDLPIRPSEDFGRFGQHSKSAMFLLGAGMTCANLHNPDYDFPDELIPIGTGVFVQTLLAKLY